MSHSRLLYNLRKRKIDDIIVDWIINFLKDCFIVLRMLDYEISEFIIEIDITQEFKISLILYLYYNVDLMNIENDVNLNAIDIDFVNDVIFMTKEDTTSEIIKALAILVTRAQKWVFRHVFKFDVNKFHLVHFFSSNKKIFLDTIMLRLSSSIKELKSKSYSKYLRVIIDNHLHWNEHLNQIKIKVIKKLVYLSMLVESIWEINVKDLRRIYIFIVLSQYLYCCSMWYVLASEYNFKNRENKVLRIMQRIQKRVVVIIASVFRIIFDVVLDIEIYLTSIKIKLDDALNNVLLRAAINSVYIYIFSSRTSLTKKLNFFNFFIRLDTLFKKYVKLNSLQTLKYRYKVVYQSNLKRLKYITWSRT